MCRQEACSLTHSLILLKQGGGGGEGGGADCKEGRTIIDPPTHSMCSCRGRQTANTLESNRRCEKAETECEDTLEREQLVKLPSTGRFEDRFSHCQAAFDRACIGPAHPGQV